MSYLNLKRRDTNSKNNGIVAKGSFDRLRQGDERPMATFTPTYRERTLRSVTQEKWLLNFNSVLKDREMFMTRHALDKIERSQWPLTCVQAGELFESAILSCDF